MNRIKNIAVIGLLIVAMIAMVPSASASTYISLENAVVGQNYYFLDSAEGEIIYADFNPHTTPALNGLPAGWAMNRVAKINHDSIFYRWDSGTVIVYTSTDGVRWQFKESTAFRWKYWPYTTTIKMNAGVYYRFVFKSYTTPYLSIGMNIV